MKLFFALVLLFINIFLAKKLGPNEYGLFVFSISLISVFTVFSVFGLDKLNLRHIQILIGTNRFGVIQKFIRYSHILCFIVSVCFAFLFFFLYEYFLSSNFSLSDGTILVLISVIVIESFVKLQKGQLQGLKKIKLSGIPDLIIRPTLFLFLLIFIINSGDISHIFQAYLFVSLIVITLSSLFLFRTHKKNDLLENNNFLSIDLIKESIIILAAELTIVLNSNIDVIMVGFYLDNYQTGVYALANRGALFIAFIIGAIAIIKGSYIARLHSKGKFLEMQSLVTFVTRIMAFIALCFFLIYFFYGEDFLEYFGSDYIHSKTALLILSFSQLFNAATGAVGLILIIMGYSKHVTATLFIVLLLNIALNIYLIPNYHVIGAAIATAISIIIWNIILAIIVVKKIHIDPTIFGILKYND